MVTGADPPIRVVELAPGQTHDLRHRVLRTGTIATGVVWNGDEDPGTVHLGVVRDGAVVGISTWLPQDFPGDTETRTVRLRGMAIDPLWQHAGLGRRILQVGCDRAARDGADLVWAHARSTALGFYLAAGFVPHGAEFAEPATGLPHVLISRRLDDPAVPS